MQTLNSKCHVLSFTSQHFGADPVLAEETEAARRILTSTSRSILPITGSKERQCQRQDPGVWELRPRSQPGLGSPTSGGFQVMA